MEVRDCCIFFSFHKLMLSYLLTGDTLVGEKNVILLNGGDRVLLGQLGALGRMLCLNLSFEGTAKGIVNGKVGGLFFVESAAVSRFHSVFYHLVPVGLVLFLSSFVDGILIN